MYVFMLCAIGVSTNADNCRLNCVNTYIPCPGSSICDEYTGECRNHTYNDSPTFSSKNASRGNIIEPEEYLYQYVVLPIFLTTEGNSPDPNRKQQWTISIMHKQSRDEPVFVRVKCRGHDPNISSYTYCQDTAVRKVRRGSVEYYNFTGIDGHSKTGKIYHVVSIEANKPIISRIQSVLDKNCAALYFLWPAGEVSRKYVFPFLSDHSFFLVVTVDEPTFVEINLKFKKVQKLNMKTKSKGNPFDEDYRYKFHLRKYNAYLFVKRDFKELSSATAVIVNASSPVVVYTGVSDRAGEVLCSHGHEVEHVRKGRSTDRFYLVPPIEIPVGDVPITNKIYITALTYHTEIQIDDHDVKYLKEIGDTYVYNVTKGNRMIRVIGRKRFMIFHFLSRTGKTGQTDVAFVQPPSVARYGHVWQGLFERRLALTKSVVSEGIFIGLHDTQLAFENTCMLTIDKAFSVGKTVQSRHGYIGNLSKSVPLAHNTWYFTIPVQKVI